MRHSKGDRCWLWRGQRSPLHLPPRGQVRVECDGNNVHWLKRSWLLKLSSDGEHWSRNLKLTCSIVGEGVWCLPKRMRRPSTLWPLCNASRSKASLTCGSWIARECILSSRVSTTEL